MKGIILAGGNGTRMLPCTKVTNKHCLPVYDRPMIYYPLQTLTRAGIDDIMIVTGGNNPGDFLKLLENGREFGAKEIHYAYQEGAGGIAQALGLAQEFAGQDRIAVILGDNIFEDDVAAYARSFEEQKSGAKIFLKEVADPQRFGVADIKDGRVINIEEKPKSPKSNYAVTGLYMYDQQVWEIIKTLKPSGRGELEITDVNNFYVNQQSMTCEMVKGFWSDAGTFDSLLRAANFLAQRHGQ
jgi:glucose-1-phosphate thymidylyltransferase